MSEALADRLAPILAPYNRADAPGLAVGVRWDGQVFRRGYGLQSLESGLVNGPTVRMRIGSTTKQFTCLAVLLLAEAGRLDLDEDLRRWLPELGVAVTARHLMQHIGGVRCHLDLWSLTSGMTARWPTDEPFDLLCRLATVNFPAGARFAYSNGGYAILSRLVERVAETPFAAFLQTRIFEPCGLRDTELLVWDGDLRPGLATLHVRAGEGWKRGQMSIPLEGEGGLISTVDDLLTWQGQSLAPKVGSEAIWRAMSTRTPLDGGGLSDYGLGLITREHRGVTLVGHAGAVLGGRSEVLSVPDHGLDLVILANRSDLVLRDIANRIVEALLPTVLAPPPTSASMETLKPREGVYRDPSSGQFLALGREGEVAVADFGSAKAPLMEDGGGLFFSGALGDMRFNADEIQADVTSSLEVVECGVPRRFERMEPGDGWPPPGRYRNAEIPADAELRASANGVALLVQTPFGRVEHHLTPLGAGCWRIEEAGGAAGWSLLELDDSEGSRTLRLSTMRTWRLAFEEAVAPPPPGPHATVHGGRRAEPTDRGVGDAPADS